MKQILQTYFIYSLHLIPNWIFNFHEHWGISQSQFENIKHNLNVLCLNSATHHDLKVVSYKSKIEIQQKICNKTFYDRLKMEDRKTVYAEMFFFFFNKMSFNTVNYNTENRYSYERKLNGVNLEEWRCVSFHIIVSYR